MIGLEYVRTMARYNRWMNRALYDCGEKLTDAQRKENVGAFFKSLHGTLNHLLVGDGVWMGRFVGPVFVPTSLAQARSLQNLGHRPLVVVTAARDALLATRRQRKSDRRRSETIGDQ